jgi:NAD dependent epimerase/dehydratase
MDVSREYAGKRVLITGAGGFIGSHLTEACIDLGATVTAMVHYNGAGTWGMLDALSPARRGSIEVIAGDIQDGDFMRAAVRGKDVVFHLAALIAIPYSYVAPRSYVRTNVEGTLNVLEAARDGSVPRVVHTSTSEVYGTARERPISEAHPLQGQSPYSASKIGADKLAEAYYRSFDLSVVTVRPFNTYGPRQSARAFIPTVISQALANDAVKLGSLDPQRDLTFVGDTVDGFLRAGVAADVAGEVINLGTGASHSIGDVASRILRLLGRDIPIVSDPLRVRPRDSEVMELISDNRRAGRLLGWAPRVDLEEGLQRTIEYVGQNLAAYRVDRYNI